MKKILLGGILLTSFLVLNAQNTSGKTSGKIGINTVNPKQTLDVNGTIRIKTPGEAREGSYISWNETTKQWISTEQYSEDKNMYSVTLAVHLGVAGQDFANWVPLRINASKYHVVVTQAYLVESKQGRGQGASYYHNYNGAKSSLPAFIRTPLIYNENYNNKTIGQVEDKIRFVNGYLKMENGSDNVPALGYLAIPQKDVRVEQRGDDYQLYADYKLVTPSKNIDYTWIVTLFVVKKNWVNDLGRKVIN